MKSSASGRNPGNVASNERSQQECYERFLKLWEEYGYSKRFDFLGGRPSSKGKIRVRCKLCGHEQERTGNVVQKHTNMRCSSCWIHLNDETNAPTDYGLARRVVEDYEHGMTVADIAKCYGMQDRPVSKMINNSEGVDVNPNRSEYKRKYSHRQKHTAQLKATSRRVGWSKQLGNIANANDSIAKVLDRNSSSWDTVLNHEPVIATCKHCGKTWVHWPKFERYAHMKPSVYCSKKCGYKHYKTGGVGHRLRKAGVSALRKDVITLDEVIARDGGVCYLCGNKVDKQDCWNDKHGNMCCGDRYPTIEHVVPISKGGLHTWDNVRLACHICNSKKSTTNEGVYIGADKCTQGMLELAI